MTVRKRTIWLMTALLATACAQGPQQRMTPPEPALAGLPVYEHTLANGLKVVVRENHRAPVVVSQIWYKVGSAYEHDGITGVSHVLEHMMFKGTKRFKPGEFSRIIAANGGRENAFTSRDYTSYFQQWEKSRLPISFEMEADRMRNLVLLEEEFQKERQVVIEERRMRTEDNPQALTYEQFTATAYVSSPYRSPVIGWMNDLESMQMDDLAQWYRIWYAPNNATLVVVGDVAAAEVFALAEQHFGDIPTSEIPARKPRHEVEQKGLRRLQVEVPAKVPMLIMGYKVPSVVNTEEAWEPYALEVLAGILDGGNSARFSRNLVRGSQVVSGIGAGYDPFTPQQEVFTISGTPAAEKSVDEVEQAVRAELERLKKEPVSTAELERVKAQVVAADVYQKDSIFYQAMQIGTLETVGLGWRLGEEYVARIKAITAEQVQAVARKYFVDQGLTVGELVPLPLEQASHGEGGIDG